MDEKSSIFGSEEFSRIPKKVLTSSVIRRYLLEGRGWRADSRYAAVARVSRQARRDPVEFKCKHGAIEPRLMASVPFGGSFGICHGAISTKADVDVDRERRFACAQTDKR